MSRATAYLRFFTFGFVLAFLLALTITALSSFFPYKKYSHKEHELNSRPRMSDDSLRTPNSSNASVNTIKKMERVTRKANLDFDLGRVIAAIRGNDPTSFNLLRPEILSHDPTKELVYRTKIKEEILKRLELELSRSNWMQWNDPSTKKKTSARLFIDQLRFTNFEFGRYAETASLLFTALYSSTSAGKVFSSEEELYYLLLETDKLFKERTPAAFSSRMHLDTEITEDISFQSNLENLRAEFIVRYCINNPMQLKTQFILLSTIQDEYLNEKVSDAYAKLLIKSVSEISPRYREELRMTFVIPERARRLLKLSPELSRPLQEFYRLALKDSITRKDIKVAKTMYVQYNGLFPESDALEIFKSEIKLLEDNLEQTKVTETDQSNIAETSSEQNPISKLFSLNEKQISTFDFDTAVVSTDRSLVSSIEKYGLIIIILLGGLVFLVKSRGSILKKFILKKDMVRDKENQASKAESPPPAHLPLGRLEPLDKSGPRAGRTTKSEPVPLRSIPRRKRVNS